LISQLPDQEREREREIERERGEECEREGEGGGRGKASEGKSDLTGARKGKREAKNNIYKTLWGKMGNDFRNFDIEVVAYWCCHTRTPDGTLRQRGSDFASLPFQPRAIECAVWKLNQISCIKGGFLRDEPY